MHTYTQLSLNEASALMVLHGDIDISAHLEVLTSSSTYTEVQGSVLRHATEEEIISAFDDIMTA